MKLKKECELLSDYYFELPENLIAQTPAQPVDSCKLLYLDRGKKKIDDYQFYSLPELLEPGDLLLFNNSRVEARRVFFQRQSETYSGGRFEALFLERDSQNSSLWSVLIKKRKKLKHLEYLVAEKNSSLCFQVLKNNDGTTFLKEPIPLTPEIFDEIGQMPVPPYFNREEVEEDRKNYQNPFGEIGGSVAAPTASLHFTNKIIEKLRNRSIDIEFATLHVGYGTFAPLNLENFQRGVLHEEYYSVEEHVAKKIASKEYNRLIAVGTTTLRILETIYRKSGGLYNSHLNGKTDIFIKPPDQIYSVDGLITNFHLPGSSLLMLASAMGGKELVLNAYNHAIHQGYSFYSYGDAMLIL